MRIDDESFICVHISFGNKYLNFPRKYQEPSGSTLGEERVFQAEMSQKIAKSNQDNDMKIVLPGDNVTEHIVPTNSTNKIGSGLRIGDNTVMATQAGRLVQNHKAYYVKENLRRYRPALEDRVVGIVEERLGSDGVGGDVYRINIGASHPASLSNLSFEGATKRNRPSLQTGQVLFARVAQLHDGVLDPELSCQLGPHDGGIPRKDWMTNEGCYGELRGGTVCRISTGLARELLHPDNVVLNELAKAKLAFEVAVGVNGFLWVHSGLPEYTILLQNAIKNSQVLTEEQVRAMVKSLICKY